MKRIRLPMCRYGERDFDVSYLNWGFHNNDTQIAEADSILKIINPHRILKILDLACGTGTHAIYWAEKGHDVTAVDISETFINEGKKRAADKGIDVNFVVHDINTLEYQDDFDLVTWIEISFFNDDIVHNIYRFLRKDGHLIFDVRNPENPKAKKREGNWRTWGEEDGIFYLERHEMNDETGEHEDIWITIDTRKGNIVERFGGGKKITLSDKIEILKKTGFSNIKLMTMEGNVFTHGEESYWLWMVAEK